MKCRWKKKANYIFIARHDIASTKVINSIKFSSLN